MTDLTLIPLKCAECGREIERHPSVGNMRSIGSKQYCNSHERYTECFTCGVLVPVGMEFANTCDHY